MRNSEGIPTRVVGPAVLAFAVLASAFPVLARQSVGQSGGSPPESVAIVPFINLTEGPEDEWIGAGIAESLATGLPRRYAVISRERVSETAGESNGAGEAAPDEALAVGRRLGAQVRGQRRLPAT